MSRLNSTRGSSITASLAALSQLAGDIEAIAGETDPAVQHAREVAHRGTARMGLDPDCVVVAVAGATGSGKSSLVNAIAGTDVATASVRRPTTSSPLAVVWGAGGAQLVESMGIGEVHRVRANRSDGLIVVDLPDIDSRATEHHEQARRLMETADVLLWVFDPQKYADASLHRDYLVPLASHSDSMIAVLNKRDTLTDTDAGAVLRSLAELLASEGLARVPVLSCSATTGEGVTEVSEMLAECAADKEAAARRLRADIGVAARGLLPLVGSEETPAITDDAVAGLVEALGVAAGVDEVAAACAADYRRDGRAVAGHPVTKWVGRAGVSPLKRLGLGSPGTTPAHAELERSSLAGRSAADDAVAGRGIRGFARNITDELPSAYASHWRRSFEHTTAGLDDALDQVVVSTELPRGACWWWPVMAVAQWVFFAAIVVGLGFLAAKSWLDWFATSAFGDDVIGPVPWAGVTVIVGLLGTLLCAGLVSAGLSAGGSSVARSAKRRLRDGVEEVVAERIITPSRHVLSQHTEHRARVLELADLPG